MRLVLSLALVLAAAAPALAKSCTERLVFVRKLIDHDLSTGFIGKDVHTKMSADLDKAETICKSGGDAQAQLLISLTEKKYGYPQN